MYIDVMKEDGLENGFDDLKNVKDKRFSLVGDYRKMIGKPEDLKYRMIQYSDPNQNLTVCNSSLSISSRVLILKNACIQIVVMLKIIEFYSYQI